jgi:hypothetical protein
MESHADLSTALEVAPCLREGLRDEAEAARLRSVTQREQSKQAHSGAFQPIMDLREAHLILRRCGTPVRPDRSLGLGGEAIPRAGWRGGLARRARCPGRVGPADVAAVLQGGV